MTPFKTVRGSGMLFFSLFFVFGFGFGSGSCRLSCKGDDDTLMIQHVFDTCEKILFQNKCVSGPLHMQGRSNITIVFEEGSELVAGPQKWNTTTWLDFQDVSFLTIAGNGTVDMNGKMWWTGSNETPNRPPMMVVNGSDVNITNVVLKNGAAWMLSLYGQNHHIQGKNHLQQTNTHLFDPFPKLGLANFVV